MFKEFSEILGACDLHIVMKKKDNHITITTVPKSHDDELQMIPLSMTGTVEELEAEYFNQVSNPVIRATGLHSNLEQVTIDLDQKKTPTAKKSKSKPKPAPKVAKPNPRAGLPEPNYGEPKVAKPAKGESTEKKGEPQAQPQLDFDEDF